MTFEESIPVAKQLAENQLKKGFDVEAFLNSVIKMLGELYYSCTSPQEKELFNILPDKLKQVFSPTVV